MMRSPRSIFALSVFALVILTALLSLVWLPGDPFHADPYRAWENPSPSNPLGLDGSGRDILSQLILGSRVTVIVAVGATAVAGVFGAIFALLGSVGRRWMREPIAVLIDVLIAFPTLLIAMMFASVFGGSVWVVVMAVGIGFGVNIGRVMRAEIMQVARTDYVLSARAIGTSRLRILTRHILPNVSAVFILQLALAMGIAILAEAGLSYLGFGAPPSMPSWGRMLAEAQPFLSVHPLTVMWPGLTITLTVLASYLLGDTLRETLDPNLRTRANPRKTTSTGVFAR